MLTKSTSTSAGGHVVAQEVIPEVNADSRFDFGPGLFTRCSICRKLSKNRGDMGTMKVLCLRCYHSRLNGPNLLERPKLAEDANVNEKENSDGVSEQMVKEQAAQARAEAQHWVEDIVTMSRKKKADAEAARQTAERVAKTEAEKKVSKFLTSRGFKGTVNSKRSSMFKYRYPLHIAVKEQDAEMVRLLLSAGADKSLKNSSGKMPAQKAEKYCKQKECDAASLDVLWALGCRVLF